jgi:hypothetical protein
LRSDGIVKEKSVLGDQSHHAPEARRFPFAQIGAVKSEAAGGRLVKAQKHHGESGFAAAAGSRHAQAFAFGKRQAEVPEGLPAVGIGQAHAFEADGPGKPAFRGAGHAAFGFQKAEIFRGNGEVLHVANAPPSGQADLDGAV